MNSRRLPDHTTREYLTDSTDNARYQSQSRSSGEYSKNDDRYTAYRSSGSDAHYTHTHGAQRYSDDGYHAYSAHPPTDRFPVDEDVWQLDNESAEFPDDRITFNRADDGYHEHEPDHQDYAASLDAHSSYSAVDDYYDDGTSIPDFVSATQSHRSAKNGELTDADFIDVPAAHNGLKPGKVVALTLGVICLCAFAVLLVISIKPQLSKLDIVQMDGYGGQQVARQIDYTGQLNKCAGLTDCSSEERELITNANTPAQNSDNTPTDSRVVVPVEKMSDLREIPAVSLTNSDWIEQLAPQYVRHQWSNVRSAPAEDSSIVTSLAKGTSVNPIGRNGEWFEIEVPGKAGSSGTIGFMHQSTISENPTTR